MSANQRDIVFASMNLYNLQLPGKPMYPRSKPYTEAEYAAKIAWTADMIRQLDADVISFQELWTREALAEAFSAAGLADDYQLAFIVDGSWDGVTVAAAVRRPWEIRAQRRHKGFPEGFALKKRKRSMADIQSDPPAADLQKDEAAQEAFVPSHEDEELDVQIYEFARSVLQVTVGHANAPEVPPIEVFGSHLKSRLATPLDDPEYRDSTIRPHRTALGSAISTIRRIAEATALRIILNDAMSDNDVPVVVLGDLNDGQFSNTLSILTDQPSYRVYADSRAARRNDDGLYSAATMQALRSLSPADYTHEFKNVREIIDHVLVSEQFYEHSENRRWAFREMQIWNDHLADHGKAKSDHGLVRVAFDWLPAPNA